MKELLTQRLEPVEEGGSLYCSTIYDVSYWLGAPMFAPSQKRTLRSLE